MRTGEKRLVVIWRFKDDWEIRMYHVDTMKQAEAMAIQLRQNEKIEYVNISEEIAL